MAQIRETKRMKITPLKCTLSERKTANGGKIYNLNFKPESADIEMSAVTFSDTVAQEFEKNINKEVESEFSIGEYQGSPSYTLNEIAGVRTSGFKKGQGFQRDVVSEERKVAAMVAGRLMEFGDAKMLKNPIRGWEKLADDVYAWISKRPSEPEANGGKTEQVTPVTEADIPPEMQ